MTITMATTTIMIINTKPCIFESPLSPGAMDLLIELFILTIVEPLPWLSEVEPRLRPLSQDLFSPLVSGIKNMLN